MKNLIKDHPFLWLIVKVLMKFYKPDDVGFFDSKMTSFENFGKFE